MKKLILILLFLFSYNASSQNVQMAFDYFRKGEYEKAASIYKKLFDKNKYNSLYFNYLLKSYQELEDFDKAENLILAQKRRIKNRYELDVELGYNYQLQNKNKIADSLFNIAISNANKNPKNALKIGKSFQDHHLLDAALQVYLNGKKQNPNGNYEYYLAQIYAEKGEIEKMFTAYLDLIEKNKNYYTTVYRYLSKFITNDAQDEYNKLLKRQLIIRLQKKPNIAWNKLLSWLYATQQDYAKALRQEIAIYKREGNSFTNLFSLAQKAFDTKDSETAFNAIQFIYENALDIDTKIKAKEQEIFYTIYGKNVLKTTEEIEQEFQQVFIEFGKGDASLPIQILYADFLTFKKNNPQKAIEILKNAEKAALNKQDKAKIKIKLADIFVFNGKYNQALVTYTQVQQDVRSSNIANKARLKIAKTSYFKGDFDWAKTQLKVLKSATSKLISNDALALNLLISDNIVDDTIRTALKKYAKAELLTYQNKTQQAIDTLSLVLKDFKGHAIEDEALFKQAELYKSQQKFAFAEHNYQKIIQLKKDGILADNATYELGLLYETILNDKEKAKEMYEKIIFEYPASIYLVDARKRFRKLRGDKIE
ncbi:MAG TPA: tetratricopeptide repeat protein [Flavobacteriia bacterium]|nr:tetratricopeptide repeat protein [Flavobacteriia bacterium]